MAEYIEETMLNLGDVLKEKQLKDLAKIAKIQ